MATWSSDPWVLLPGTLCTADVFSPLLERLGVPEDNRQFIEISRPGVADYADTLQATLKGGEIVCGFSLGAMVLAHNLGATRNAKALVLLACNPYPDARGNRANREAVRDRILAGEAREWVIENWSAMSSSPCERLRDFVAGMAEATSHLIPDQTELAASRPGADKDLAAAAVPLVFVTGSRDRLTPPERVRGIAERADLAVLKDLDGLGHFALIEAPDRVADAIRQGLYAVLTPTRTEDLSHDTSANQPFSS